MSDSTSDDLQDDLQKLLHRSRNLKVHTHEVDDVVASLRDEVENVLGAHVDGADGAAEEGGRNGAID